MRQPVSVTITSFALYKYVRGEHRLMDNEAMGGIQYVTDEKGRRVAVLIDLKMHRDLWEDIEDLLVSRSRRREKRIPLEKVKAGIISRTR